MKKDDEGRTILVADDDPFNLRLLAELCQSAGYRVITAEDGGQVLELVARERPDLLILDVMMPVHDGFEVMQLLRGDPELAGIPVVLVTAAGDVETRSRGIDLGAEDYITKPYRVFEIQQRIRNALRVRAAEREAARERDRARDAETVDALTRAGTSQQLTISLEYEHTRAARYGHPLTVMVVRLANHEEIVAQAGQEAGEGALVQLAQGLRNCIRGIDHMFRSDLDEFTLLLPETDAEGSLVVARRIVESASDGSLWSASIQPLPLIRVGHASFPGDKVHEGEALRRLALTRVQ